MNKPKNKQKTGSVSIPAKRIIQLIDAVSREHLCSIEFGDMVKIKKQIGDNTGSRIEIEFDNNKRIRNIKFENGGYNDSLTLKSGFAKLFDIISDA